MIPEEVAILILCGLLEAQDFECVAFVAATGEWLLHVLAYNLIRITNLLRTKGQQVVVA